MKNKIFHSELAAVIVAGLALGLPARLVFAQQNLVVNGSFEVGGQAGVEDFPDWYLVGPASNNSDFGVAESSATPDVAEQGNFYAYFHGHPTDSSQDCLGQTVQLTVGAQYTISYYLATDGTTYGSGAEMIAVIGTSYGIDLTQDLLLTSFMPNSSNAIPYQKFTTTITATQPSEILSFHGVDATSSILLDNIVMTPALPSLTPGLSLTNTLVFNWTAPTNVYYLQVNTSLSPTNWVTLTNPPVNAGSNYQVVLPPPAGNRYYRLVLP